MAIYLKKFENHTQYENYINGSDAILPNVSICTTEGDVHYNPSTPVPPTPVETIVVAKFDVTDTSNPIQIIGEYADSPFSAIEIDGVEQPSVVSAYTFSFSTGGEHTVKYTLTDPTSIGTYAFYECYSLTSIDIPNSITSISDYAFYGCFRLTSVVIPDSVTSIGEYAFNDCSQLESFTVMATTPPSINSIFGGEMYTPRIYVPSTSVETYKAAEYWSVYADYIEPIS